MQVYSRQPNIRKLCFWIPILVNITIWMKALLERGSSISKLITVTCLILSFQTPSNFVACTFTCKSALRFVLGCGWHTFKAVYIMVVKKSALNTPSYNPLKLSLRIRL